MALYKFGGGEPVKVESAADIDSTPDGIWTPGCSHACTPLA